jgi:hypothetical protein
MPDHPGPLAGIREPLEHLMFSTHGYKPDACSACAKARSVPAPKGARRKEKR